MKKKFVLLPVKKLKPHERIRRERVEELMRKIREKKAFTKPIIVEENHFVILDGHHRFAALKKMGAKLIPAYLLNYNSKEVRVFLRRKEMREKLIKDCILRTALSGKVFPHKTTRHLIKDRPQRIKVALRELF